VGTSSGCLPEVPTPRDAKTNGKGMVRHICLCWHVLQLHCVNPPIILTAISVWFLLLNSFPHPFVLIRCRPSPTSTEHMVFQPSSGHLGTSFAALFTLMWAVCIGGCPFVDNSLPRTLCCMSSVGDRHAKQQRAKPRALGLSCTLLPPFVSLLSGHRDGVGQIPRASKCHA
jgi:hypothetical protein